MKILFCGAEFPYAVQALKAHLSKRHELKTMAGSKPLTAQVSEVEVLLPLVRRINQEVIDAAPKLRLIQQFGVGLDSVDMEYATRCGIYVANAPGANSTSVAEHALFLMLALAKNFKEAQQNFSSRKIGMPPSSELHGKTLGIVGLGASGTELAKRAKCLGMRVIAIKKNPNPKLAEKLGIDFLGTPKDLDVLLKSDYISIHAPLTPETRGMFGREEFEKMKRTACIVNVARGGIIDEDALCQALREKKIAGAGIDVFWDYPPNPEKPVFQLKNVIVTPHIAGVSFEAYDRVAKIVMENIERVEKNELPKNLVNKDVLKAVGQK